MGLAAAQARFLTITTRKSDCEFLSMRYSHQKIALSRDLTDISNEYQDSLNATKLVYDFYGTGDESTALSYSLLMTPSELNTYMPILTTDTSGRVVLDSKYAAAARAAGIPQEGLDCQPSTTVRNAFLDGLEAQGLITSTQCETYKGIQYLPNYGVGSSDHVVSEQTSNLTLDQMITNYMNSSEGLTITFDTDSIAAMLNNYTNDDNNNVEIRDASNTNYNDREFTIQDILKGDYRLLAQVEASKTCDTADALSQVQSFGIIQNILTEIDKIFGKGTEAQAAITQARREISQWLDGSTQVLNKNGYTRERGSKGYDGVINCMNDGAFNNGWHGINKITHLRYGGEGQDAYRNADKLKGILYYNTHNNQYGIGDEENDEHFSDGIAINISNIAKMYLTYIVAHLDVAATGTSDYTVDSGGEQEKTENDKWVDITNEDDTSKVYTITTQQGVDTDQSLMSAAYDAIFNQICLRGWSENDNVTNKEYLQNMYKNGQLFLCKCFDDGYYYQENYGTETYIKEVTDDDAIAKAEAKYNTEKQKINSKEEVLDLKMKNLDAEISSLTTEYDSVKSLISKQVERSFKRYEA